MAHQLPNPDISRYSPISPEIVTLAYIGSAKQGMSLATLQGRLKKLVSPSDVDAVVCSFLQRGEATLEKTVSLTSKGKDAAKKALRRDAGETWEVIKARRLPLIAVGLDPDDAETRRKFAKFDALKAAAIAVAFGLPKETMASPKAVGGELVWRLLRSGLPEVVGKGPFPVIEKPAIVERVLLSGLAGVRARAFPEAMSALAAAAVGVEKFDAGALRERLIQIGVERATSGTSGRRTDDLVPSKAKPVANVNFAARVREIADSLTTPPFQGRVAIAQVYDAYGKVHPDAGSLASFKERLVQSAKTRDIGLARRDLPERMSWDLRERSEARWDSYEVHFVITDWKSST